MSTRSKIRKQLSQNLNNKEYRDSFVETHIGTGLSFQIRAMRKERGWTQKQLAKRLGSSNQEGISRLENSGYGRFSIETLRRLASAFDVALLMRFVPFSELIDRVSSVKYGDLAVPPFTEDSGLNNWEDVANVRSIAGFEQSAIALPYHVRIDTKTGPESETKVAENG